VSEINEPFPLESAGLNHIHTDYSLSLSDLRKLADRGLDLSPKLSISLDAQARMMVDFALAGELTDPRGVIDVRLSRLRAAIWDFFTNQNKQTLAELMDVYSLVFA